MLVRAVPRDERSVFRRLGPGRNSELGGGWSHAYGEVGGRGRGDSGELPACSDACSLRGAEFRGLVAE